MLTNIAPVLKFYSKSKSYSIHIFCLLVLSLIWPNYSKAKDILRLDESRMFNQVNAQYNIEIMRKAMEITEAEFGDYEIKFVTNDIPNLRLRKMIAEGNVINATIKVTTPEWEKMTTPIRIPVRRGILSYRLLLINKNTREEFSKVKTIEQLKTKTVGLMRQWAIWETMTTLNYPVINSSSYNAIFDMLKLQRFDYIPRGVHEIYKEIHQSKNGLKNLMVEPNLALYIPAPFYVFVSPKEPRLARRFELGLNKMVKEGILQEMLNKYYGEYLKYADLKNKTILKVGNPSLPPKTPLERKELWLKWD